MRMWGDSVTKLLVASGTILNEVSFPCYQMFCFQHSIISHEEDHKSVVIQSHHEYVSQILIWKMAARIPGSSSYDGETPGENNYENATVSGKQYMVVHLGRLKEHEGSIFRISWSADGSKFMSVSDDRRFVHEPHCPCLETFLFSKLSL
jgi:WD repeat-containing protein 6